MLQAGGSPSLQVAGLISLHRECSQQGCRQAVGLRASYGLSWQTDRLLSRDSKLTDSLQVAVLIVLYRVCSQEARKQALEPLAGYDLSCQTDRL